MARFNTLKSNVKLNGEGRHEFEQENLIDHSFCAVVMEHMKILKFK